MHADIDVVERCCTVPNTIVGELLGELIPECLVINRSRAAPSYLDLVVHAFNMIYVMDLSVRILLVCEVIDRPGEYHNAILYRSLHSAKPLAGERFMNFCVYLSVVLREARQRNCQD